jgi:protein-disulfide isomerase
MMSSARREVAIALVLCGSLLLTVRALVRQIPESEPLGPQDAQIPAWERFATAGNRLGPADALVTIVVFGDYECDFCKELEYSLRSVRRTFPRRVSIVYRHYPLVGIHQNAYQAARVAECGAQQQRFEAVHTLLYDQESLERIDGNAIGSTSSVPDLPQFLDCVSRTNRVGAIEQDLSDARELGTRRTPTVIVDGTLVARLPDSLSLGRRIRSLLERGGG